MTKMIPKDEAKYLEVVALHSSRRTQGVGGSLRAFRRAGLRSAVDKWKDQSEEVKGPKGGRVSTCNDSCKNNAGKRYPKLFKQMLQNTLKCF